MRLPDSNVTQDYLKLIYAAGEWGEAGMSVSALAGRLGVAASTVSQTVRRLAAEGLVHHQPYGVVTLSPAGRLAALAVVRRHRLIETWLVEHLGYAWDEVHDEAEVLEHAVSDLLVDRVDALLGHPTRDPHGDPIPTRDGRVTVPRAVPLVAVAAGDGGTVARISDAEPQVLRLLAEVGVRLDVELTVVGSDPAVGTTTVELAAAGGISPVALGAEAVAAIWVARRA